jgi:hypothetical protein
MGQPTERLPNPDREAAALWFRSISRDYAHNEGWVEVNRRFHEIAATARTFLREEFPDDDQREAAFDGLTVGLLAIAHFADIENLARLFEEGEASQPDHPSPQGSPSSSG